ncbi:MAG: hypothetical protein K0R76_1305 [Alphaproteobacteria bacterium]|jgi:hypothetical protein|nr:hypothetical protein [Alphaproteobacteria bacterium]
MMALKLKIFTFKKYPLSLVVSASQGFSSKHYLRNALSQSIHWDKRKSAIQAQLLAGTYALSMIRMGSDGTIKTF